MAYSTEIATQLANQLGKFATYNRHQLAGQAANLDFWLSEVRHCLYVIDDYKQRFERMNQAQEAYVESHGTVEFHLSDPCCTQGRPRARRIPDAELKGARHSILESTYRFLVRCHNEGFVDEPTLREICDGWEIGVEYRDLRPAKYSPP